MLTPLRAIRSRSALLALALAGASFFAFPDPVYAGPCELDGNLGCAAEGEAPGNPGNPGNGGNGGGNGNNGDNGDNGNNDPGDGPSDDGDPGLVVDVGDPPEAPLPDTEDTVAKAFNQIEFPVPTIETEPELKTYVRVKTSFWLPAAQTEDITVQASVGAAEGVQPQTITATATLAKVLWDFFEDGIPPCDGPGRPNGEGDGEDCDYYFKTSSIYHGLEALPITATPLWNITWTCEGVCPGEDAGIVDDEYASPAGEIELVVDEIQTEANKN